MVEKIIMVLEKGKGYYQSREKGNLTDFDYLKTIDQYEKLFEI